MYTCTNLKASSILLWSHFLDFGNLAPSPPKKALLTNPDMSDIIRFKIA